MDQVRIERIEWARLSGRRPRRVGCNARLGEHGLEVSLPLARVISGDGVAGFGWSRISPQEAEELIGLPLRRALDPQGGVRAPYRSLEYPLLDLAGQIAGKPVWAVVGGQGRQGGALQVRCYDTSLYMDDLDIEDDGEAAALIAAQALEGAARGHTAFKVKVGRGAMHMPLEAGTRRDIWVIHAVREAVGPQGEVMIDANNGYNLNLAKRVLAETAGDRLYWMEEAFHEDGTLYAHLKEWLAAQGLHTLIADGEGDASPRLLDWARRGLVDVVQYDVLRPGFSRWLEVGPQLDAWGARSAPHHYGEPFGNYAACHLATAIRGFAFVEWDEATVPGLDASGYSISGGWVRVPDRPGFGLKLDLDLYGRAVREGGFVVTS
jgi:L-alanine-DL-glutamate epimerase-like enolase superfamily enzyme